MPRTPMPRTPMTRTWTILSAFVALGVAAGEAAAQSYPSKPIRIFVGFAPGGPADVMARLIAQRMQAALGQSVVVDNRPGAGGVVGTEIAARAQPDGYTLMMGTASNIAVNPLLTRAPYDPVTDFVAIAHTSTVPLVLVVLPAVPAKSV